MNVDRERFLMIGHVEAWEPIYFFMLNHRGSSEDLVEKIGLIQMGTDTALDRWVHLNDATNSPSTQQFHSMAAKASNSQLRAYWLFLAVRLMHPYHDYDKAPSDGLCRVVNASVSELQELAMDSKIAEVCEEYLAHVNLKLSEVGKRSDLVYGGLDALVPKETRLRGRLIAALVGLWFEYHPRFQHIGAKIFIPSDIWDVEVNEGLTDKVKLGNHMVRMWKFQNR